jgi:uncharacterized protein (TIGR02217 family)
MAITVLSDVILSNAVIEAGVRGKNMRMNQRVQNQAGFVTANIIWQATMRQYELGIASMSVASWQQLEGIHEITEGGAKGFLIEDPKDCVISSTSVGLLYPIVAGAVGGTIGVGYGVPTMQMYKRYSVTGSSTTKDRKITRPQQTPSVPSLFRGGGAVTLGASAGNAAIDYTTGVVTFVADTSEAMSSITVGASTILNFSSGAGIVAAMSVGQRVYITGVTGTAASTLNSLSHAITAKGASSLTISTTTTGLTASSGTAFKYPQASEALAWTGRFYVPVHFADDYIDWDIERPGTFDNRLVSGPSVLLNEIKE